MIVFVNAILNSILWDYIVTQQSTHDSGWIDTYEQIKRTTSIASKAFDDIEYWYMCKGA